MNYSIVFKLLGIILLIMAVAFTICLLVSLAMDSSFDFDNWAICILSSITLALTCYMTGRRGNNQMFRKEAMAIISFSWLVSSLIGAMPYVLILDCNLVDAIFESTAGLTTTGASVFSNIEEMPKALMFWRCMSQWIGGLGMVVFFVGILSFIGVSGKMLYSHEASAKSCDLASSRIQKSVVNIIILYMSLSAICALSYHISGMTWFDAICHMFTTLSTGGFSTHGESFAYFKSPLIEWLCVIFMLCGGTSFIFILGVMSIKQKFDYRQYTEVLVYYGIFVFITLILTFTLMGYDANFQEWGETLRDSAFQVASLMTSTGFSSTDFEKWIPIEHVLLLAVMVIGGCSGSTAGGIKVIRIVIAFKVCLIHIEKAFRPKIIRSVQINNQALNDSGRDGAVYYLLLATAVCFIAFPIFALMEPMMSTEGIISSVIASIFNVGPGFAEVGSTDNYGFLHGHSKLFLSFLMIMGRLEFYAIVALFIPSFWKKF